MSGRGGKRPGAGRKKGIPNKRTAAKMEAIEKAGVTPLDYMLGVMRDPLPEDVEPQVKIAAMGLRFEAAKAAAPYVHPRRGVVDGDAGDTGTVNIGNINVLNSFGEGGVQAVREFVAGLATKHRELAALPRTGED